MSQTREGKQAKPIWLLEAAVQNNAYQDIGMEMATDEPVYETPTEGRAPSLPNVVAKPKTVSRTKTCWLFALSFTLIGISLIISLASVLMYSTGGSINQHDAENRKTSATPSVLVEEPDATTNWSQQSVENLMNDFKWLQAKLEAEELKTSLLQIRVNATENKQKAQELSQNSKFTVLQVQLNSSQKKQEDLNANMTKLKSDMYDVIQGQNNLKANFEVMKTNLSKINSTLSEKLQYLQSLVVSHHSNPEQFKCPSDLYEYNPHSNTCYRLVYTLQTWYSGKQFCEAHGEFLGTFGTLESAYWFANLRINNYGWLADDKGIWVGGQYLPGQHWSWYGRLKGLVNDGLWANSYFSYGDIAQCMFNDRGSNGLFNHFFHEDCTGKGYILCETAQL